MVPSRVRTKASPWEEHHRRPPSQGRYGTVLPRARTRAAAPSLEYHGTLPSRPWTGGLPRRARAEADPSQEYHGTLPSRACGEAVPSQGRYGTVLPRAWTRAAAPSRAGAEASPPPEEQGTVPSRYRGKLSPWLVKHGALRWQASAGAPPSETRTEAAAPRAQTEAVPSRQGHGPAPPPARTRALPWQLRVQPLPSGALPEAAPRSRRRREAVPHRARTKAVPWRGPHGILPTRASMGALAPPPPSGATARRVPPRTAWSTGQQSSWKTSPGARGESGGVERKRDAAGVGAGRDARRDGHTALCRAGCDFQDRGASSVGGIGSEAWPRRRTFGSCPSAGSQRGRRAPSCSSRTPGGSPRLTPSRAT